MKEPGSEVDLVVATPMESALLEAAANTIQHMADDAALVCGRRGPIVLVHALLGAAAQITVQRMLSKEAFLRMVDLAWENALHDEAEHNKGRHNA